MAPVRSCKGVRELPTVSPTGVREGLMNVERDPTADVGAPCSFVGSAGMTGAAAAAACAPWPPAINGSPAATAAPSAPAAPVSSVRREMVSSVVTSFNWSSIANRS